MKRGRQIQPFEGFTRDIHEALLKCLGIFGMQGETSRHRVTAMPYQQIGALVQGVVDIEFRDRAAGSFNKVALHRTDNGGFVVRLGQPPRSQTHNTRIVLRRSRKQHRYVRVLGCDIEHGRFDDLVGNLFAAGVKRVELLGKPTSLKGIPAGKQAEGIQGTLYAPGSIQSRTDDKAKVPGIEFGRVNRSYLS